MSRQKQKVRLIVDQYIGRFYKLNKHGYFHRFFVIGNAGVALDVACILRLLKIDVEVIEQYMLELND